MAGFSPGLVSLKERAMLQVEAAAEESLREAYGC